MTELGAALTIYGVTAAYLRAKKRSAGSWPPIESLSDELGFGPASR